MNTIDKHPSIFEVTPEQWARQVHTLNAAALLSVYAADEARLLLIHALPLCDTHPSLKWVWTTLHHHFGIKRVEQEKKLKAARPCCPEDATA